LVIWPVKIVPKMTYNVLSGILSLCTTTSTTTTTTMSIVVFIGAFHSSLGGSHVVDTWA